MNIASYLNPFRTSPVAPVNMSNDDFRKMKQDPAAFMVSLIQQQYTLYKKEIKHWQAAKMAANNIFYPRRYLLQLIYNDLVDDLFIYGQMQNRINRIINKPFRITDAISGKEDKTKTELLKTAWVYDFNKYAMESGFYGPELIYFSKMINGRVTDVDIALRDHVVPETNELLYQVSDMNGIDYLNSDLAKYSVAVGKPKELGLFNKITPLWIFKKHSWQSWDQFEEMFGVPIRWAKTASTDKKVQATITNWLKDMGQASYALFPEGTTFDIKESTRSDAFQVFEMKRKACNEEIALGINGQFETSSASGSRAKAQTVVESTQDEITQSDLRMISFVWNDDVIPKLTALGYPFNPERDRWEFDLNKELAPLDKLKVYQGVSQMGFEIDQDDVSTTFNIKLTGKKAPAVLPPVADDPLKDEEQEDPAPVKPDDKQPQNKVISQIIAMHQGISKLYTNV